MKKYYVLGFLFSEDYEKVVLIRKNKPESMVGLLNGVGGKIELKDDSPLMAMIREFKEETGVEIGTWQEFCKLNDTKYEIYCFKTTGDVSPVKTMEEEEVKVYNIFDLYEESFVSNLPWLLELARDSDKLYAHINYL